MEFKTIIKDGINKLYTNLNSNDINYLNRRMYKIIELLYYQYNLNKNDFEYQLIQNDYRDVKWLSTLLLPHLNVDHGKLNSFNDMYHSKLHDVDINKTEPSYIFTNLQYGRCKRTGTYNDVKCNEIDFSYEHLDHNFYLFLESIIVSSNKLYVNWQNIIPLPISDIKTNTTYINTNDIFMSQQLREFDIMKFSESDITQDDKKLLGSLYVGDIYNTIHTYLYEEIKEIKLLIFDIVVFPFRKRYSAIHILNEIYSEENLMADCLNNLQWESLTELKQNKFTEIWNKIIDTHNSGKEYSVKNYNITANDIDSVSHYTISRISMERLLRGILVSFEKRFGSRSNVIKSGYISIRRSDDELEELLQLDDGDINEFKYDIIYESLRHIKGEFLYEFFREILQDFKKTYYSAQLLSEDKQNIQESQALEEDLSIKNYYNFAKSLVSHVKDKKYTQFNRNWKSLEESEKKIILERLNNTNKDVMSWFNIGRYIQSLFDAGYASGKKNIKQINLDIYTSIRSHLVYIIFEILAVKGILSKFIPDKLVTDNKYINNKKINELIKGKYFETSTSNKYATHCYYYLTEMPYYSSGQIFEILSKDSWYTMQAMEWVSQLGFCHHFINNRVSYITGSTGVGKSTHVPKLYLYYLKGIDYLSGGKVVCTQPRKTPTEKNADEVSKQLGLPIVELDDKNVPILDKDGNKKSIHNYSVQMQHQDKKHTKNINQLILKFITDGSLLMEFKNILPIFKKMKPNNSPTKINLYDVVIIDEAHEHNKNMDLLLTLLKIFGYYNPSLRVVILSATMDEDEPNYRRFYRAINDNQKYPLNTFIRNNKLDRINIDRRFHISAPGTGTRFIVKEEYREGYDVEVLINELIKTRKGDILVFQPGEADILGLISKLNVTLPDNWIALPFYSSMRNDRRNFIEDIDFKFPTLKMNRTHDFNTVESLEDGTSNFTNFVLIATNIAEASITIRRLFYVIDLGVRKINYYDYKRRNNKLITQYISETSRVQRKGRVGRTGEGEAYFLYKKGINTDNKTPAEISIANISSDIFTRLRNKSEDKFSIEAHYKLLRNWYETQNGKFTWKGNIAHNDYTFIDYIPEFYETGFELSDITDNFGRFYIVHPDELNIRRNIFGKIVGIIGDDVKLNNSTGMIESQKMNSFVDNFSLNNYIEYGPNGDVAKTELGINIYDIIDKFKFDNTDYAKLIIYAILNSCEDKMIGMVALLNLLRNGDISTLFTVNKATGTANLENVIGSFQFRDCTSDYDILIKIIDNLYKSIGNTELINLVDLSKKIEYIRAKSKLVEINGIVYNMNNVRSIYEDFDFDENKDRETIIDHFINSEEQANNSKLDQFVIEFAKSYNIDSKILKKYFRAHMKLRDTVKSLYYSDKRNKSYKDFIDKYRGIYSDLYSEFDKFKLSIVMTYPYNIIYSIRGSNSYLPVYFPVGNNIVGLDKIKVFQNSKTKYLNKIFFDEKYSKGLCIYQIYNADRDAITNITYLENKYLKIFKQIYNSDRIRNLLQKYKDKLSKHVNDKYVDKIQKSKQFRFAIPKDYTILSNAYYSYNELLQVLDII